jgi:hypothetical protein
MDTYDKGLKLFPDDKQADEERVKRTHAYPKYINY